MCSTTRNFWSGDEAKIRAVELESCNTVYIESYHHSYIEWVRLEERLRLGLLKSGAVCMEVVSLILIVGIYIFLIP